jgi:prepilin-type N-terminal cleavage/methylation domain-containing protein
MMNAKTKAKAQSMPSSVTKGLTPKAGLQPIHGFTLIELLVVVAIIAVLVAMLLPTLSAARENARNVVCMSNLKQASTALVVYADAYNDEIPPAAIVGYDAIISQNIYWFDVLGAYIGQIKDNSSPFLKKGIFQCPSKKAFGPRWEQHGYGWNFDYLGYKSNPTTQNGIGYNSRLHRIDPQTILFGDNMDESDPSVTSEIHVFLFPAFIDESYIAARHNDGGYYASADGRVIGLSRREIVDRRTVAHTGVTSRWGASYSPMIHRLFTTNED